MNEEAGTPIPGEAPTGEAKAREGGWVSKEEFQEKYGDDPPRKWIDSDDFNERGELFDRIKAQTWKLKKNEEMMSTLGADVQNMKDLLRGTRDAEYARAKRELTAEMKRAAAEEDTARVDQISDHMEKMTEEHHKQVPTQPQIDPIITQWGAENPWIDNDPVLAAAAYQFGENLKRMNPNLGGKEFLDAMKDGVMAQFPDRFPKRKTPPKVGGASAGSIGDMDTGDLPQEYQDAVASYRGMGKDNKTIKSYIKQWRDAGMI